MGDMTYAQMFETFCHDQGIVIAPEIIYWICLEMQAVEEGDFQETPTVEAFIASLTPAQQQEFERWIEYVKAYTGIA